MNFIRNHFSKLTLMLALSIFFTACTDQEDPVLVPEELTIEQVVDVAMSNKSGIDVNGFVQWIHHIQGNSIKVSSIDDRQFYYTLDEDRMLFYLNTEMEEQTNLISPRSLSSADGDIKCSNSTQNSNGTTTYTYLECGGLFCYLNTVILDANGREISSEPERLMGLNFTHFINRWCNQQGLFDL